MILFILKNNTIIKLNIVNNLLNIVNNLLNIIYNG
jgi:hypothetical protein